MACGPLVGNRLDSYGQRVNDVPALPSGPLAAASLSIVQTTASAPIAGHSIRSFLYARLLAGHDGRLNDAAYDEDLLFAACVMHDLGLGRLAAGQARFEVEGADLAAALLTEHGIAAPDVDRVWEAIALHSSVGIAHRRGLLTYLTHRGVFIDAGRDTGIPAGVPPILPCIPCIANATVHVVGIDSVTPDRPMIVIGRDQTSELRLLVTAPSGDSAYNLPPIEPALSMECE
jgi:hypothetical protein